jgi:hypothetical protein
MSNADVVRRFEDEFKNQSRFDVVHQLMTEEFVHDLPYPGIPPGREGMKAIGSAVTGAFREISVSVDLILSDEAMLGAVMDQLADPQAFLARVADRGRIRLMCTTVASKPRAKTNWS